MKKIKWKQIGTSDEESANHRILWIYCYRHNEGCRGKPQWFACVSLKGISTNSRLGPTRNSLHTAKQDAIELIKELLLDCHKALMTEIKDFNLMDKTE